jgi:hypothetical protein
VQAILVRCRISRLAPLDRATGQPVRRYEHPHPGALVPIDIKKLGNIPAGGGHRFLGRAAGMPNHQADRSGGQLSRHHNPRQGHGFIHAAVDDHSRLAYAQIHADETSQTAVGFLQRAQAWFAARGLVIQQVLTDNRSCYRSQLWTQAGQQLAIIAKRTRPYRPQTNGKAERFNRTLLEGWAYRRLYVSEAARRAAFGPWLHWYNHPGPTAHSAVVHPSPAAPTSPSPTTSSGAGNPEAVRMVAVATLLGGQLGEAAVMVDRAGGVLVHAMVLNGGHVLQAIVGNNPDAGWLGGQPPRSASPWTATATYTRRPTRRSATGWIRSTWLATRPSRAG